MSIGVQILLIICLTIVAILYIAAKYGNNGKK